MTPYRRRRIGQLSRQYAQFLDADKALFFPTVKYGRRKAKEIAGAAAKVGAKVTRKGFFAKREQEPGHPIDKAKLIKNRRTGRYEIIGVRQTAKGHREFSRVPLAGADEISESFDEFKKLAPKRFKPSDPRRYRFVVTDRQGSFISHNTFTSIEQLWKHLQNYRRRGAHQLALIESLTIIEVEKAPGQTRWDRDKDRIVAELGGPYGEEGVEEYDQLEDEMDF